MNRKGQLGVTESDELFGYAFFVLIVVFLMIGYFVFVSAQIEDINVGVFSELEKSIVTRNLLYSSQCLGVQVPGSSSGVIYLDAFDTSVLNSCTGLTSASQVGLSANLIYGEGISLNIKSANYGSRLAVSADNYVYPVKLSSGENAKLELIMR